MAILSRPLLRAQQRFDLEDLNALLSAARTDAHYWTKQFLSNKSYIIKGFNLDPTSIGTSATAKILLTDATLINGNNTGDISWYTTSNSETSLDIPYGIGGLQAGRNYVELEITTQTGTELQRAFWDPSANSGQGVEFVRTVETVVDLALSVSVNQAGFTGNPNKIPLAIVDHGGTAVLGILDKRELFFRLATPANPNRSFAWDRNEATTTLDFTASTTGFIVGQEVNIGPSVIATVAEVVSPLQIKVRGLSSDNFTIGNSVSSSTSTVGELKSYFESFGGSDKDIHSFKDALDALMTEIKVIKGTDFWWQLGGALSLPTLLNYVNSCVVPLTTTSHFKWTGTDLLISDDKKVGMATSDPIAAIRVPGYTGDMRLTRQDGKGGSTPLAIGDGQILYVEMPADYNNGSVTPYDYSESGSGGHNYRIADKGSFSPSDLNYIIAFREGTTLIIPGTGELKPGEDVDIGNGISKETLAYIGATNEVDANPDYTTTPSADLSNQFTTNNSLTQAISINAANINDIAKGILRPYDEALYIISDIPDNSHEEQGPVAIDDIITMPLDSRDSDAIRKYRVGSGSLFVFLNGQHLILTEDYEEVGVVGTLSNEVKFKQQLDIGDIVDFRIINPQYIGTAGLEQPFFVNYITGQNGVGIPTGHIYNRAPSLFAERLQVYRNGVNLIRSSSAGTPEQRYAEDSNASVVLEVPAEPTDVFTMFNLESPDAVISIMTGLATTVLTVPTYVMGNNSLKVYRNGVLMSYDLATPAIARYSETSTNTITLSVISDLSDVFKIVVGNLPAWRSFQTGLSTTTLTVPSFGTNPERLMVFRNGIMMFQSTSLGTLTDRYQPSGTTNLILSEPAVPSDFFIIFKA